MAANIETVMIEFPACEIDDDIPGTYTVSVDKRLCDMLTNPSLKSDMKKNILKNISKTATKTIDEQIASASPESKEQQADNSSDKTPHFWTNMEEQALVTLRLDMESEFTKGMKCHSTLWQKIKRELNIDITIVQIINKWNALKKKYKKVTDNNNKSGSERQDFKYLEEFDEVYQKRAATAPKDLIDSLNTLPYTQDTETGDDLTTPRPCPKRVHTPSSDTTPKSKSLKSEHIKAMKDMQDVGQQILNDIKRMHEEKMRKFLDKGFNK